MNGKIGKSIKVKHTPGFVAFDKLKLITAPRA